MTSFTVIFTYWSNYLLLQEEVISHVRRNEMKKHLLTRSFMIKTLKTKNHLKVEINPMVCRNKTRDLRAALKLILTSQHSEHPSSESYIKNVSIKSPCNFSSTCSRKDEK